MLPILTFHWIDPQPAVLAYPPLRLANLLAHLAHTGHQTVDLLDVVNRLRRGELLPARSVVVTFDDGDHSVYTDAFPLLRRYGMTATVFLITGQSTARADDTRLPNLLGRAGLSWGEIREMQGHGISFGAHTVTHADLTRVDAAALERELHDSQAIIQDRLGVDVPCFAYPYGRHHARVRAVVDKYFACACSDRLGLVTLNSDMLALERVEMSYLRAGWGKTILTSNWLPIYLGARNVPRRVRRRFKG